eukprot:scaffold4253_cov269-Prasinococcus_capsulatus_cf.AAC.1
MAPPRGACRHRPRSRARPLARPTTSRPESNQSNPDGRRADGWAGGRAMVARVASRADGDALACAALFRARLGPWRGGLRDRAARRRGRAWRPPATLPSLGAALASPRGELRPTRRRARSCAPPAAGADPAQLRDGARPEPCGRKISHAAPRVISTFVTIIMMMKRRMRTKMRT